MFKRISLTLLLTTTSSQLFAQSISLTCGQSRGTQYWVDEDSETSEYILRRVELEENRRENYEEAKVEELARFSWCKQAEDRPEIIACGSREPFGFLSVTLIERTQLNISGPSDTRLVKNQDRYDLAFYVKDELPRETLSFSFNREDQCRANKQGRISI